jgi:hypothetical protein
MFGLPRGAMVQSAVIATGIFTLAAALGGAALSTATTLKMARRNDQRQDIMTARSEQRQDIQELRRDRISIYASFLTAVARSESASSYLADCLHRNAKNELANAWSWASRDRDRADHAFSELELFAGEQVREVAANLLDLVREHYKRCGEGKNEVSFTESRRSTTVAMQVELGIARIR